MAKDKTPASEKASPKSKLETGFPVVGIEHAPTASHQRALELTAPPSVLVDINHQIVTMSEEAGRFIQPSGGQIRNDVTELARPELRFDLRAALRRAFERSQPALSPPIVVHFNGAPRRVFLQVKPVALEQYSPRQAVVFFIEGDPVEAEESGKAGSGRDLASDNAIRQLKEELETSKEELQSINEALQTVNAELKVKLERVSCANNDLQNLMASTDVGTLFLDSQLRIKRFTPGISELFNIRAADEGRSITDFTHRLDYPGFTKDAQSVLKELSVIEREISSNGRWFLTRFRPYRTLDDRIEGVVCTFVDVTERLKTRDALKASEAHLRLLLSELSHRVKNTLAVVQAMARLSFADNVPRDEAVEAFTSRLGALSAAHDLLAGSDWRGAPLKDLAKKQLAPFAVDGKNITIDGPDIFLPPDLTTPLALVLHELASNAWKYGALSSAAGTLSLKWEFKDDGAEPEFQFRWREADGPKVCAPSKHGFGSYLIQNGLPEAKVALVFDPAGLLYTVTLPAKSVRSE